jgi:hypothetical protein
MAVLNTGQRDAIARAFMRLIVAEPCAFLKATLRTAVDNADDWADSAGAAIPATSYNTALNATFRAAATAAQKAALLALVCWWRAGRTLPEGQ